MKPWSPIQPAASSPKSGPRSSRSSGPASLPVRGGVRDNATRLSTSCVWLGGQWNPSRAETPFWQQWIVWKEAARWVCATRVNLVERRKVWDGWVRAKRARRSTTRLWSAHWGSETRLKRWWFFYKLCWQSWIWRLIDAKRCATMATPAHQETRRFTRGLGKPGTAAELRQSVSEVVRTSVLVVSTRLTLPFPLLSLSGLINLRRLAFTHIFSWPASTCRIYGWAL